MRGLYAIVDRASLDRRGLDPLAFARALLVAKPAALQLRDKDSSTDETGALLVALRPLCREAGVPLVANDRVDLALGAECDMLHVGQTDASPSEVRAAAPGLPFGISTHTEAQLVKALEQEPRYVAFGPVFGTRSKEHPDPAVGLDGLERAHRLAHGKAPLVAIGGITLDSLAQVAELADMAAAIGDLVPPPELAPADAYAWATERARAMQAAFGAAR